MLGGLLVLLWNPEPVVRPSLPSLLYLLGAIITAALKATKLTIVNVTKATAEKFKVGPPSDEATQMGPVVSERQWSKIQGYISKGIAEGAGRAPYFKDFDQASSWLKNEVHDGDVVLFKGSRAAAVETLMNSVFPQN